MRATLPLHPFIPSTYLVWFAPNVPFFFGVQYTLCLENTLEQTAFAGLQVNIR